EGSDPQDESKLQFSIRRGFTLFRSKVDVLAADGTLVGWFKSKVWTIGVSFRVFNAEGREVALVKGDWKGWNFRFLDSEQNELGTITKKWAGVGKELFTSADNYIIALNGESEPNRAALLLAAGLAIDTVYKEK
ncbi:MAG: phospholipid scramblase-related protein, partial [Phycisphaerae bacterium]|nr:phospholipid scramblase-related protein [Phycisphaerae bacterium]